MHTIELTTVEAAGVLACILAVLGKDKPEDEGDLLQASLESAAQKISDVLKVPVVLAG
jgi:hypothetical protein